MLSADEVLISRFCSVVLAPQLVAELAEAGYDLAVVDLMFNECGLALASHLGIPAVGYWAFSFASGVQVSINNTDRRASSAFLKSTMNKATTTAYYLFAKL